MDAPPKPWTDDQVVLLFLLAPAAAARGDWSAIAAACEHPLGSCRVTWTKLRAHLAAGKPLDGFGKVSRRAPKRIWTQQEETMLFQWRTVDKKNFFEIDGLLGRSRGASNTKFRQRFGTAPDPAGITLPALKAIHAANPQPQYKTLTAALLGDPLPGRSVWDRIQAGILEPPVYLGRAAWHPAKITLPGGAQQ